MKENNNYDFLVEYITTKMTEWIIRDQNIDLVDALLQLHNSETFEKLCDKGTDMYIESPAYVYEIYLEELRNGSLRSIT